MSKPTRHRRPYHDCPGPNCNRPLDQWVPDGKYIPPGIPAVPAQDGEDRLRALREFVEGAKNANCKINPWDLDPLIAALEARPREESPK